MKINYKAVAVSVPLAIGVQAILIAIGHFLFKDNLNYSLVTFLGVIGGFIVYLNVDKWLSCRLPESN